MKLCQKANSISCLGTCTSIYKKVIAKSFKNLENIFSIVLKVHDSNTDGLFTMADSSSFLSPYEILLRAKKKYLGLL